MKASFKQWTRASAIICLTLLISCPKSIVAQEVTPIIIPIGSEINEPEIQNESMRNGNDLWLSDFYAIAPNAMWPYQQVECFYTYIDFYIEGDSAPTELVYDIAILNESTQNTVFNDSLTLIVDSLPFIYEGPAFENCFTPASNITQYTGTYSIASDCVDPEPNNNQRTFQFETNEFIFSKETEPTILVVPDASNWEPEEPHSWAFGNHYHIVSDCPQALDAIFALGNSEDVAERLLSINLYKWEDLNFDSNMDPDEREIVGFNFYQITGNETPQDLITVPLLDYPSGNNQPIFLDANTDYVLMIEYNTADQVDLFLAASDEYNYDAQRFISYELGAPRYGSILGVDAILEDEPYSSAGFSGTVTSVARLVIDETIIDNTVDLNNRNDQNLIISPNPVSGRLVIELAENAEISDFKTTIFNTRGQKILEKEILPTMTDQVEINVSHLANGLYFVLLQNEQTALSGSFIVQH